MGHTSLNPMCSLELVKAYPPLPNILLHQGLEVAISFVSRLSILVWYLPRVIAKFRFSSVSL